MGKCFVPGCNTNHFILEIPIEEREKTPVFRLPKNEDQLALREKKYSIKNFVQGSSFMFKILGGGIRHNKEEGKGEA